MRNFLFIAAIMVGLMVQAQPKLVGHRGCRFNTPENPVTPNYENTLSALKFAQSLGIYAAEFDVNLTKDGKVVVYHGPNVPGETKKIQELTFKETRKVVLPGGHKIPTLKEWFKAAKKDPKTKIIMEIKKHPTPQLETKAVELSMALVKKMKMEGQVEYTTFSEWMCKEIHRVNPKAKVLYLSSGNNVHDAAYCKEKGYDGMSYECNSFIGKPELVEEAREKGIETTMWLVNDKEMFDWAVEHHIDYISSDHPERIKTYLEALKK